MSNLPARTDEERKAAIQRAQARRNATTEQVFDPDSQTLIDVPTDQIKDYVDAGFKVGPDADFAMQQAGLLGTVATGALGVAKGASAGLSELAIPQSLRALQRSTAEAHKVADVAGDMAGSLATLALGGAGGAKVLARAGMGQYAKLGAAAGRIAMGGVQGGIQSEVDSVRNNSPLTAERFMQGVGMGMLINTGGEVAGKVLEKSVPLFQKQLGRFLNKAKTFGYLDRIGASTDAFAGGLEEALPNATETSALGDEARQAFGGLQPEPSQLPPPLRTRPKAAAYLPRAGKGYKPELRYDQSVEPLPMADAELLPPPRDTEANFRFGPDSMRQKVRDLPLPLSQTESRAAWDMFDREAADAARMGEHEGMEGIASDLREQRDAYSADRGMPDDEVAQIAAKRDELLAPDAEFDAAFNRAQRPGVEPVNPLDEVNEDVVSPKLSIENVAPEAPEQPVRFKQAKPKRPTLNQLGKADKAFAAQPDMSLPTKFGYEPGPGQMPQLSPAQAKYAIKNDPGFMKEVSGAFTKTGVGAFGLMHLIPGYGTGLAQAYGASQAAMLASRRAIVGMLNREQALNVVLDRVMAPASKLTGRVVKNAIQGVSPYISQGYLGGNVDDEYTAISQGAINSASDPAALEQYYSGRYGQMLAQNPELYGNIVAQSAKQHAYLASQVPKDPRDNPGMLDEPYDPPRSDKVKMIEQYKAVNDPYSVLANPTADGIAAVAATHPETLQLIQKMVLAEIADPKVAKKLTPAQTTRLSILLQLPVTGRDSPQFLSMIQQLAQANGAEPAPSGPTNPGGANPPNLGGTQTGNFASAVAPPSQQQQLEDLR